MKTTSVPLSICGVSLAVMASIVWLAMAPTNVSMLASEPDVVVRESGTDATVRWVETLLRESRDRSQVVPPSAAELRSVTRLFARTLILEDDFSELQAAWSEWKMTLTNIECARQSFWLLQETSDAERGRGIYAFRTSKAASLALQAPHSGYDLHTGEVAVRLFVEQPLRCAAWNSVRRGQLDLAHTEGTYFQAFTQAIGETVPDMLVVQIHGFEAQKRTTAAGEGASLIVSNGSDRPESWFLKAGLAFGRGLPTESVAMYPLDVRELGGTTNAQGLLLSRLGNRNFLHLECNRSLRQRLLANQSARSEIMDSLTEFLRLKNGPG